MALINRKGDIVLSGSTGRAFLKRMKQPDEEIMEKRDRFISEAREKIEVIHKKDRITLRVR